MRWWSPQATEPRPASQAERVQPKVQQPRRAVNAAVDANGRTTEAARAHGVAQGKGEALAAAVRRASDGARPAGGGGLEAAPADGAGGRRALADDLFPAGQ
jgi:hypothetical protein